MKNRILFFLAVLQLANCQTSDSTPQDLVKKVDQQISQNISSSPNRPNLPREFQAYIPTQFDDGLKLVQANAREKNPPNTRTVQFYDISKNPLARSVTKEISVQSGYRAMYAYPGTEFFANVKIEKSMPGQFSSDKATAIEHIKNYCDAKNVTAERVAALDMNNLPTPMKAEFDRSTEEEKEKFLKMGALIKSKNGKSIAIHEGTRKGYEYVKCTETVLPMILDNSIDFIHIFIPEDDVTITAYLLYQHNAAFKTIDEFMVLDQKFIEGYINFIAANSR